MKQRIDAIEKQSRSYTIRNELRERYFGGYDAKALRYYANVWPLDWESADNSESDVESVNQVIDRLQPFLRYSPGECVFSTTIIIT
jgi:broad specificity phosphatase PhoE